MLNHPLVLYLCLYSKLMSSHHITLYSSGLLDNISNHIIIFQHWDGKMIETLPAGKQAPVSCAQSQPQLLITLRHTELGPQQPPACQRTSYTSAATSQSGDLIYLSSHQPIRRPCIPQQPPASHRTSYTSVATSHSEDLIYLSSYQPVRGPHIPQQPPAT